MNEIVNFNEFEISDVESLELIEKEHRLGYGSTELLPWAGGTSYRDIAEIVIYDKDGPWEHPLYLIHSYHRTELGINNVCKMASEYIDNTYPDVEKLSICAKIEDDKINLVTLVRSYSGRPNFASLFDYMGDKVVETQDDREVHVTGSLIIPEEKYVYSEEDIEAFNRLRREQNEVFQKATKEKPFLNSIEEYVPTKLPSSLDYAEPIYDLRTADMQMKLIGDYEKFTDVFRDMLKMVSGTELYNYFSVIRGEKDQDAFLNGLKDYLEKNYVKNQLLFEEDLPAMMKKLRRALFQLYIIQDLIDDPKVSDIKITSYNCIRCRVDGKAYITNLTFVDEKDYKRFIDALAIRNGISQSVPTQSFTDDKDSGYLLRFTLISPYTTSNGCPVIHVRKINRKKMTSDELLGKMFPQVVHDYILDCGKTSRGVVICGAPGCGKTVFLNWFLEYAYEQSAEILVIQENDELFAYRKGVIFEHTVEHPQGDEEYVDLETLGQNALVAGANVFIIGEVKGGEICSAMTLANSSCRTAMTLHASSATEAVDKMVDLAQRGIAKNPEQAKQMLKAFQTIIFLKNFSVNEIVEIEDYDKEKKEMIFKYIYKKVEE